MLKKVLTCKPNNFQVEYQINPWMKPGSVDSKLALEQWQNLIRAYQDNGIQVENIQQVDGLADMPFAADQGLVVDYDRKIVVLSNFKYPQRQGETAEYAKWFEANGYQVEYLPKDLNFEGGGEILPANGKYFIGHGLRNSENTYKYLSQKYELNFVPLELVTEEFYHLDTCLFILNPTTAFYHPEAFSRNSIEILQKEFSDLIEFNREEVKNFAANSVVSGRTVFGQVGNYDFKNKLQEMKYDLIELDLSQFMLSGGGIHCLTFELERQAEFSLTLNQKSNQKIFNSLKKVQ